jgi:hypothetical protein
MEATGRPLRQLYQPGVSLMEHTFKGWTIHRRDVPAGRLSQMHHGSGYWTMSPWLIYKVWKADRFLPRFCTAVTYMEKDLYIC